RLELDGDSGIRLFENREDLVVGIDVLGPPGPHLEGDVVARGVVFGRSLAAGVLTVLARGCARVTGGACAKSYGRGEQHAASEEERVLFHGQFSLTIRWGGGVCRWGGGRGFAAARAIASRTEPSQASRCARAAEIETRARCDTSAGLSSPSASAS